MSESELISTPEGLENISKLPVVFDLLTKKGYSDDQIEKIAGGNFLRVFNDVINNSLSGKQQISL